MARSVSVSRGRRRQHLGAYMSGASDLNVETQSFEIQMVAGYSMSLYGAPPLYVVGSFQVKSGDPYWHGQDFGLGNLLDETRQVPGSLTTQSLDVCLVALLVGPPLALLLVAGIAARLLPASTQSALDVLTRNPMQALWDVRWYALAAVLAALLTMIISLWRAARLDLWGLLIALGGFFPRSIWRIQHSYSTARPRSCCPPHWRCSRLFSCCSPRPSSCCVSFPHFCYA
jgi:hypothetical protein